MDMDALLTLHPELGYAEARLLCVLRELPSLGNAADACVAAYKDLALRIRKSYPTVRRLISKLESLGWIRRGVIGAVKVIFRSAGPAPGAIIGDHDAITNDRASSPSAIGNDHRAIAHDRAPITDDRAARSPMIAPPPVSPVDSPIVITTNVLTTSPNVVKSPDGDREATVAECVKLARRGQVGWAKMQLAALDLWLGADLDVIPIPDHLKTKPGPDVIAAPEPAAKAIVARPEKASAVAVTTLVAPEGYESPLDRSKRLLRLLGTSKAEGRAVKPQVVDDLASALTERFNNPQSLGFYRKLGWCVVRGGVDWETVANGSTKAWEYYGSRDKAAVFGDMIVGWLESAELAYAKAKGGRS
jgi:hypothetical protein